MEGLKILDMPPISPYLLVRAEKALNIKLYDWKKAYILDKYCDPAAAARRASGKTLAYIKNWSIIATDPGKDTTFNSRNGR